MKFTYGFVLATFLNPWTLQIFERCVLFFAHNELVYMESRYFVAFVPFCFKTCFLGALRSLQMMILGSKTVTLYFVYICIVFGIFLTALLRFHDMHIFFPNALLDTGGI